jgi:pSer/pThr/pTyr-binding forkhead associated (FHA) protein
MYVYILNGPQEGNRIPLKTGKFTIGRSPESSISLPEDPFVSGTHAELRCERDGKLVLKDHGSRNGTFLLGEAVHEPKELNPGDIFQVGKTFLKVSRRAAERYFIQDEAVEGTPEAILVIDMVGPSRIADAMGDRIAGRVKNALSVKLNESLKKHPADFLKNTGDGFLVIFSNVKQAVKFAMEFLNDLKSHETSRGIHVRMGVHFGETTILPDGDRRGMAVDMAFRVESVKVDDMHQTAVGIKKDMLPRIDRIFITEVVQRMIGSDSQVKTRCIGFFDLKGFTGRHKIFEVMI